MPVILSVREQERNEPPHLTQLSTQPFYYLSMAIDETIFTYDGVDYTDADHIAILFVTKQAVIDNNLQEFINEEMDEFYEIDEGYHHVITFGNLYTTDVNDSTSRFYTDEAYEEEVTLQCHGLPTNLLQQEGVMVSGWMNG